MGALKTKDGMSMGSFVAIWAGLLCIVGIDVFLTYRHFSSQKLLLFLLIFACSEPSTAAIFCMHWKYERARRLRRLVPALRALLFVMHHYWPDELRRD